MSKTEALMLAVMAFVVLVFSDYIGGTRTTELEQRIEKLEQQILEVKDEH